MNEKNIEIRDDEFRVLGHPGQRKAPVGKGKRRNLGIAIVSALIVIALGLLIIIFWPRSKPQDPVISPNVEALAVDSLTLLGHSSQTAYTEKLDTVINDVRLSIYIPHNATPQLAVGALDERDSSIILAARAADIRADNQDILGAFVLKGEVLARGKSKKGFCAIIDGNVTIGMAENTPLFEETTEKDGYFFRQYPLVIKGDMVQSGPKGKALRRAICSRSGEVFIVVSETDESFHDFSQALVDLGVENAIYLCGGRNAKGWYMNKDNMTIPIIELDNNDKFNKESYIIWAQIN